jgi:bifunctional DNA-binding transcriptional regulator/antitoxin component of YhaV-PrlF toxin-antitoxin module
VNSPVFRARLIRPEAVGAWTFAMIPASVVRHLGLRARLRVTGTIDGAPFRSSLMPRGGGRLFVVVPSALRDRIGKSPGQSVELSLTLDRRPVILRVPADLDAALGAARGTFDGLAPSHRKAYIQWVTSAKTPETRGRRIAKAVQMVHRGQTLN